MIQLPSPSPAKSTLNQPTGRPGREWQSWFDEVHRHLTANTSLYNEQITINPDFHWSRTKGNTPTTADGEFVEKWDVAAGGMTFSITPTYYTSTQDSSETGSDRYINVDITTVNTNEFVIYQGLPKSLSKYQNKIISFSSLLKNNTSTTFKCKFYVGFSLTGVGYDYYVDSSVMTIKEGANPLSATVRSPKIATDNQTNIVAIALKLIDLPGPINFDMFFLKTELAQFATLLRVHHGVEKIKIDNPA